MHTEICPLLCRHNAWYSSHPYMACTWHASLCLAFQPSIHGLHPARVLIHGLYPARVLMPGVYLAFTEPGIVIQNMVSNIFYLPAMYMRCMLANCHVPCTCPCMQLAFLLMIYRRCMKLRTIYTLSAA